MKFHNRSSNYKLRVSDEITPLIQGLHPQIKQKIRSALQRIIANPYDGKSLQNELDGLRSFTVRRLKIIYRIVSKECIEIIAIGPRKIIYEETFSLIKKETGPLD